jgi:alpha-glucosidase (family GH31 glycosyl hydrolase)
MQDQFLAGSDLLVKPVVSSQQSSMQVYLPGDQVNSRNTHESNNSSLGMNMMEQEFTEALKQLV